MSNLTKNLIIDNHLFVSISLSLVIFFLVKLFKTNNLISLLKISLIYNITSFYLICYRIDQANNYLISLKLNETEILKNHSLIDKNTRFSSNTGAYSTAGQNPPRTLMFQLGKNLAGTAGSTNDSFLGKLKKVKLSVITDLPLFISTTISEINKRIADKERELERKKTELESASSSEPAFTTNINAEIGKILEVEGKNIIKKILRQMLVMYSENLIPRTIGEVLHL